MAKEKPLSQAEVEAQQKQREKELADELVSVRIRRFDRRQDRASGQDHHFTGFGEEFLRGRHRLLCGVFNHLSRAATPWTARGPPWRAVYGIPRRV